MSEEWASMESTLIGYDRQLELATVIMHEPPKPQQDTHKPTGVRLAKLLHQYDGSPSSELWRTIQALSFEILRESK